MSKHYVYESPDGGRTVYQREIGSSERTLTKESLKLRNDIIDEMQENKLWGSIRRCAKNDPALEELLSRAIVYYKLKYENNSL